MGWRGGGGGGTKRSIQNQPALKFIKVQKQHVIFSRHRDYLSKKRALVNLVYTWSLRKEPGVRSWNYDPTKRRLGVSFRVVKNAVPVVVNDPVIGLIDLTFWDNDPVFRLKNLAFRNCDPVFQVVNLAFLVINRYTSNHSARTSNHKTT